MNRKQLEAKLPNDKKRAALLIVQNDFSQYVDEETGENRKLTQDEIAEMCNISRMTLWRWQQDEVFRAYVNVLADGFLKAQRSFVYQQLIKAIGGPQPSVNAIKLYLQNQGLLVEKQVTEIVERTTDKSNEQLSEELAELDALLQDNEI